MSVERVNNHVLFWFAPDWSEPPEWSRAWQNEVATAVTGPESRFALRRNPRISISFSLRPLEIVDVQMLDDAAREARKLKVACCPLHGRGAVLNSAVVAPASEIAVSANGFAWQAGDYVFLQRSDDSYEVAEVTGVDELGGLIILTLADPVTSHAAGAFVWPLLFGKFSCGDLEGLTPRDGSLRVTITELTSRAAVQLGEVAPVAPDEFAMFKT